MWEQIRSNQKKSVALVIALALLLVAIGYFPGLYFFGNGIGGLIIALLVWAILNLVGYFQGDSILLGMAKAKKISREDYPRLYNVVEEMKIASGLEKMPDIYIIRDINKAAVAVTSGLLEKLSRDELQGVIGHELAHIKNRDVLLMTMCSILLGTIVILSWYASRMMFFGAVFGGRRSSSSSGGGGGAQLIILAVALVLMILAPIAAQLIYFAVSRKREYIADASSALYTRYPEGLASALEKLGTSTGQLKSANKATAPMYIVNPFRKKGMAASDLSSTHPPISERISILRAMGNASPSEYERAYQEVHQKDGRGIMPVSALSTTGALPLRPASSEGGNDEIWRRREASNALWKANKYRTVDCKCGTRLRLPPGFRGNRIRCPHCGNVISI